MANWWESAPVVTPKAPNPTSGNWWDAAPLATAAKPEEPRSGYLDMASHIAANVGEGLPIIGPYLRAGADKIASGAISLIKGEPYEEAEANLAAQRAQSNADHPYIAAGAQIAGGVIGTEPLVAAAPAAFGISQASVPVRAATAAASGSALGAADGYVRDGALGAAAGGAIGGGLGLAGPIVGNALGRGVSAIQQARANRAAAIAAGTSREAVDVVSRGLAADGVTSLSAPNIQQAGSRAMLADAGPSTRSILDTAIQRAGPGAGEASERISQRAAGAADDINGALDNALGAPQGVATRLNAIRESSQPARSAAYREAYGTPIDYAAPQARDLEAALQRVPGSIISRANNLMRVMGEESQQIMANVADDGSVVFTRMPDVRQIDYITRALNDVAQRGDGAGALGGNTAEGMAYGSLSRELRNITRSMVPQYGSALDAAADPISRRQATLFGETLLSPDTGLPPEKWSSLK